MPDCVASPMSAAMSNHGFSKWLARAGIDFHVAVTLLFRSWSIVAGGVMVIVVPATLAPQEQGYYYTFASLLGLQIFFELGLNQVIVQLVSHELAHLSRGPDGELIGDKIHLDRLRSIVALLRKWYAVAAVLFLIVTAAAGGVIFDRTGTLPRNVWLGPWLALVTATAFNLYWSPMLSVIEGYGRMGQVARLRLVQSMVGYSLVWASLAVGAGLWAVPLISMTSGLCTAYWLRWRDTPIRLLASAPSVARENAIDWRREVLPFQWRIAASWISGYLIFQLFTPIVFVHLGAVAAGKLGLALTVFSSLLSVSVSWINTKIPEMTAHIARGERQPLRETFRSVATRTAVFTVAASAALLLGSAGLRFAGWNAMERISDLSTLSCIAATTCANIVIYAAAAFMRSHREEPMLPVSAAGGMAMLLASYITASQGAFRMMLWQTIVTCMLSLPWTLMLFRHYYRRSAA